METAENRITKEFLADKLKADVQSFSITSGSNAGDNYMSVIHAIEVTFGSGDKKHLILKSFPSHPARQDFLTKSNIFSKEVKVYTHWIPELKLLDKDMVFAFAPYITGNCIDYHAPGADNNAAFDFLGNYLLMEDIRKSSGFTMVDRRKGLNFEHAIVVIKELAKIHACSWVYKEIKNVKSLVEHFEFMKDDTFNDEMMEQFKPVMDSMTNKALDHVKDELGEDSPAYQGVRKLGTLDNLTKHMQNFLDAGGINEREIEGLLRVKPPANQHYNYEPWLVGCHGDCWVNNMLFRYKEGSDHEAPQDVNLVDLQLFREACPTTDLAYFLVTSMPYQTRTKHEAEFLKIYHDEFTAICDRFSVKCLPGFNMESLRRRYRRAKIFGFFMGIPLLQIVLQDPTEAIDLDGLGSDTKDMSDIFSAVVTGSKKHQLLQEQIAGLAQELYNDGVV